MFFEYSKTIETKGNDYKIRSKARSLSVIQRVDELKKCLQFYK